MTQVVKNYVALTGEGLEIILTKLVADGATIDIIVPTATREWMTRQKEIDVNDYLVVYTPVKKEVPMTDREFVYILHSAFIRGDIR